MTKGLIRSICSCEPRQKIVIEGGEIIGDYFERIKWLENIKFSLKLKSLPAVATGRPAPVLSSDPQTSPPLLVDHVRQSMSGEWGKREQPHLLHTEAAWQCVVSAVHHCRDG